MSHMSVDSVSVQISTHASKCICVCACVCVLQHRKSTGQNLCWTLHRAHQWSLLSPLHLHLRIKLGLFGLLAFSESAIILALQQLHRFLWPNHDILEEVDGSSETFARPLATRASFMSTCKCRLATSILPKMLTVWRSLKIGLDQLTLWLCQNSYWKWPFIVDFPIENGDFQ